jgi:uncharacterized RDD family membrane protein YckC
VTFFGQRTLAKDRFSLHPVKNDREAMDPYFSQDTYEVESASRLSRLGAKVVDAVVGFAPLGAVAIFIPSAMRTGGFGPLMLFIVLAGVITVALLITQIVLLVQNGQTIGKKVLGIRMITSDGDTPSIWRVIFLRWLPFAVVAVVLEMMLKVRGSGNLIYLVDGLLIFQPNRRCLHDLFADTHVIKT